MMSTLVQPVTHQSRVHATGSAAGRFWETTWAGANQTFRLAKTVTRPPCDVTKASATTQRLFMIPSSQLFLRAAAMLAAVLIFGLCGKPWWGLGSPGTWPSRIAAACFSPRARMPLPPWIAALGVGVAARVGVVRRTHLRTRRPPSSATQYRSPAVCPTLVRTSSAALPRVPPPGRHARC